MKKIIVAIIICIVTTVSFVSCEENQRQHFYDKVEGDFTGYKLKGYAAYYEIDFSDYSYYMSEKQYPIYEDDEGYYIEIDEEKVRLYELDNPIRVSEYRVFRYVTDDDQFVESIPEGY